MAVCLKSEIQEIDLTKAGDHIGVVSSIKENKCRGILIKLSFISL
jgi:hypothetical protein